MREHKEARRNCAAARISLIWATGLSAFSRVHQPKGHAMTSAFCHPLRTELLRYGAPPLGSLRSVPEFAFLFLGRGTTTKVNSY
ncbi:hypothetical protein BO78DRAFT_217839 [Aspergillus sclerotiicarbonarius CBS 121057]|uniref:Uncharacterized protein n=1 Tax=Aspergillus sclerotiicarbonarius (strain CBS 121057 / IBT 28362) TaxID=1448318 RepID=A0A319EJ62_ASPSB|nr:hypothetical protein BO78DRAFT_217839 [Aspergillus sclerotiicarbonarius CBS 121057]